MRTLTDRDVINYQCRNDIYSFALLAFEIVYPGKTLQRNWHIKAICYQLQAMAAGRRLRLIVNLPPRCLKSFLISICYPAWMLGRNPGVKLLCASYSERLAADFSNHCRRLMASKRYREVFPTTQLSTMKNTEVEFATTKGGFRLALSVGGTLTGRGGDILIIDDPMKADVAHSDTARAEVISWYNNVANSRLDDPAHGTICLVSQRLHEDDLAGHLLRESRGWHHLCLPAVALGRERHLIGNRRYATRKPEDLLFPARLSRDELDRRCREMGSLAFSAQYQQAPLPPGGNMIKADWQPYYSVLPERETGDHLIHSWDTGFKSGASNDYSVCTVWLIKGERAYLLETIRARLEFQDLLHKVMHLKERDQPDVLLIEDQGSGQSLIQALQSKNLSATAIRPEGDKTMRLASVLPMIEEGRLWLPQDAPWLEAYRSELLAFPSGRFDDQVDSTTQALAWLRQHVPDEKVYLDPTALQRPSYWHQLDDYGW